MDRILLGLGALLILISSYQLFFAGRENSTGLKLGTLTSTLAVVKTKNALALDWRDASSGNELSENQLIYTDSNSSAEVVFNEGNALEIGENSLVKLRAAGNEQAMDLSKGFIRAKLEGGKPLKVQMNGEDYLVTGTNADIQINIQDAKGEIGVLHGEVSVVGAGVSENLTPANALEIDGDTITKKQIYFKTLLPQKNSILYVLDSPSLIKFAWTPETEAKVLVSKKLSFEKPIAQSGLPGIEINLPPGLYYYKMENAQGTSLVSSFRIIQEKAPTILRPRDGEEISVLEGEASKILLQWKHEQRLNYQIEWNNGEIKSAVTQGGSALINVEPELPFAWRVKVLDPKRPDAQWSSWQKINLALVPKPVVPTELTPHEVEFQTYEKPNETIELKWQSSSPVELQVKDPAGEIFSQKIVSNTYLYTVTKAGQYAWRVQARDDYFRSSAWSEWKTFLVEDLSLEKGEVGFQRIQLKKPDQSVTFNWKAAAGATSIFELSKDPDFKVIIKKSEVSKDSAQVNIPEVGAYYWRSRQFLPDGTLNVSEPKRVIIEPVPAPDKPSKLPDLEVPLEELPRKSTLLEKVLNFMISSAYAEESRGIVRIDLPSKEEAKGYVVRIFRDEDLTELVFEERISEKHFEWKNAQAGIYYWQYAVIDFWDRKSLFSDPAMLTIKAQDVALPEQPRLLFPIRASAVDKKNLVFKFTGSELNTSYTIEISDDKSFGKILHKKSAKTPEVSLADLALEPNLYYWRVKAFNKKQREVTSNTGRFRLLPPVEKTVIADFPSVFQKQWLSRAFFSWAPSMDSYSFKDGETGEISGNALMSFAVTGSLFKKDYAFNAEVLRQTGEVFKGESYLFQRLLIDGIKTWDRGSHHKFGLGIAVGQVSAMAYEIENSVVSSKSTGGLNYGPILRSYLAFNQTWEMQSRATYLLGEIKQIELSADAIRHWKDYLLTAGLGFTSRTYEISSGKQTSMKLSLGIGKEF